MAWVGTGIAAVGVGSSILGGLSANKKAAKAAEQQSELVKLQRKEEMRQKRLNDRMEIGTATAAAFASDVQMSGSTKRYIGGLNYQNMREMAYAKEADRLEQDAIKAGAQGAGNSFFYKAAGDALTAASVAYARGAFTSTPNFGGAPSGDVANVYSPGGSGSYSSNPGVEVVA